MTKMALNWPVDRHGYQLERPPKPRGRQGIAGNDDRVLVVRKGGPLDYRDVMQFDALYRRLAETPQTEDGVLDFVSRYGLLRPGSSAGVEAIQDEIRVVQQLLGFKEAHDWNSLKLWMAQNRKAIRVHPDFSADPSPTLYLSPGSLIDAIYLQFFQDVSTGANSRLCKRPGCGEWFYYGAGTPHRSTAEYCSPKCQKAHTYAKSKGARS
jgi:hypothetical protein